MRRKGGRSMETKDKRPVEVATEQTPREEYTTPRLLIHGTVADITRNVMASADDGLSGSAFEDQ
jgi:hypothetical protein